MLTRNNIVSVAVNREPIKNIHLISPLPSGNFDSKSGINNAYESRTIPITIPLPVSIALNLQKIDQRFHSNKKWKEKI